MALETREAPREFEEPAKVGGPDGAGGQLDEKSVFEGPQSRVFHRAENRLHAQKDTPLATLMVGSA